MYICLGKYKNTFFFICFIKNESSSCELLQEYKSISRNIYNTLVNEEYIIDYRENIVIFMMSYNKSSYDIINIRHTKSSGKVIFTQNKLMSIFYSLKNCNKEDIYIIEYDDIKKNYILNISTDSEIISSIKNTHNYLPIKNTFNLVTKVTIDKIT